MHHVSDDIAKLSVTIVIMKYVPIFYPPQLFRQGRSACVWGSACTNTSRRVASRLWGEGLCGRIPVLVDTFV